MYGKCGLHCFVAKSVIIRVTALLLLLGSASVAPSQSFAQSEKEATEDGSSTTAKTFNASIQQTIGGTSNAVESANGRNSVLEATAAEASYGFRKDNVLLAGEVFLDRERFFQSDAANTRGVEFKQSVSYQHHKNWGSRVEVDGSWSEQFASRRESAQSVSILTTDALTRREIEFTYTTILDVKDVQNELSISGRALRFNDITLPDGSTLFRSDQDRSSGAVFLTTRYRKFDKIEPFVTGLIRVRSYQDSLDENGNDRDSRTYEATVGARFVASPKLSGSLRVGYLEERFGDESAAASYTATLGANYRLTDNLRVNVAGEISQAFFTSFDDPQTIERRYGLNAGATYSVNDNVETFVRGSLTTLESTFEELDYDALQGSVGLRLKI